MAQKIVSIDVSERHMRICTIEATFRRARLIGVRQLQRQADWSAADAWSHLRAAMPPNAESVVVACEARWVAVKLLHFPPMDAKKLEGAVAFELEGQVPQAIDDLAITTFPTQRLSDGVQVLAATCPKAALAARLTALNAARIEPRALVMPAACLAEYLAGFSDGPVAIACLGASETHIAVGGPSLSFARSLRAGGDDVDRALSVRLGIDMAAARALKEQQPLLGESAADEARSGQLDALLEGLAPLVTGLLTTLKALPPGQLPRRLWVTGGLSRLVGLMPYLQARLGLPVAALDLGVATRSLAAGGGAAAVAPEHAVALAMALAQFRRGRDIPLNFRRGSFAYQGDIQLYRGQLGRIAAGTGLVLSLMLGSSAVRYGALRQQERKLDEGFCAATFGIVGRRICDPAAALSSLRQAPGGEGSQLPTFSAAALWEMLSMSVPTDLDVVFDELDLRVEAQNGQPERLTGRGEAKDFETVERLVATIRRDACVQEAEITKQRRSSTGARVEFAIAAKVSCPAGVFPGSQQRSAVAAAAPSSSPAAALPAGGAP